MNPGQQVFTQKWMKTEAQLGLIGEAEPVFCDVNNDGIKEIFWVGKPWNDRTNANAIMVCLNGLTGDIIWSQSYPQYWGAGNDMCHLPIMVYDFDKDGQFEITGGGASIMRNALTGAVKWTKTANYYGWHNPAFIDYGDHVDIYSCGGNSSPSYLRKINGATGDVINQIDLGPNSQNVCWGGIAIADINNDGYYEILCGTRNEGYSGYMYKGLVCCNESLTTMLWNKKDWLTSSQCPRIYDIDNDGYDEIIVGAQNTNQIHILDYNGGIKQTWGPFTPSLSLHVAGTVADMDNDGKMEWISANSTPPMIVDLDTGASTVIAGNSFCPIAVANVLSNYPGYEIIIAQGNSTQRGIWRYDGANYVRAIATQYGMLYWITGDVDGDGMNEVVFAGGVWNTGGAGVSLWDTSVPTPSPEPITFVPYGGMRRLNNNIYYPLPVV